MLLTAAVISALRVKDNEFIIHFYGYLFRVK